MKLKELSVKTDGGSSNNPGPAGIGVVFYSEGKKIFSYKEYIGEATNNIAEYKAFLKALEIIEENYQVGKINFMLDSELVVKQINGEYKIKNQELAKFHQQIIGKLDKIKKYEIKHIYREENQEADKLVKKAIVERK